MHWRSAASSTELTCDQLHHRGDHQCRPALILHLADASGALAGLLPACGSSSWIAAADRPCQR
ncbi:hypothetical protein FZ983_27515 [Azospirillum sp. B21]|uniref:hypothetical protein n=1 Tax=Azospirillum sp. B21 TaxID=2607496 RepID=UPI0011ED1B2F|nr:hypothetical protein [Azospirillum sp. B21]KAA0574650.1 hypothetical protein FZ983_27515 [Azospirillum sp. B21]